MLFSKRGRAIAAFLLFCFLWGCASPPAHIPASGSDLSVTESVISASDTSSVTTPIQPLPSPVPTVTQTVTDHIESLPFSTVYIEDPTLPLGMEQLQTEGVVGSHVYQIIRTFSDGTLQKEETLTLSRTEPVSQTYLKGSKPWITGTFRYPISSAITSDYGWRTLRGEQDFHYGIDLRAAVGTPIAASDGGKVIFAGRMSGISASYGNLIMIEHPNGYRSYYAHLSSFAVKEGDQVYQGQIIGKSGATGNVTGPHLHFEIRKNKVTVNPLKLLQ